MRLEFTLRSAHSVAASFELSRSEPLRNFRVDCVVLEMTENIASGNSVSGLLSLRKKAKMLGASHMTTRRKELGLHPGRVGHPTTFTDEEEAAIEDLLLSCAKVGVGLDVKLFYKVVDSIAAAKGKYVSRMKPKPSCDCHIPFQ